MTKKTVCDSNTVMPYLKIKFTEDVKFADLKLARDTTTGDVIFSWRPIEKICRLNDIDPEIFKKCHEDNVAGLIVAWYEIHLKNGGVPDPVADELIAEVRLEDQHGGGTSHPPGRG